jgi:hypothetical protein
MRRGPRNPNMTRTPCEPAHANRGGHKLYTAKTRTAEASAADGREKKGAVRARIKSNRHTRGAPLPRGWQTIPHERAPAGHARGWVPADIQADGAPASRAHTDSPRTSRPVRTAPPSHHPRAVQRDQPARAERGETIEASGRRPNEGRHEANEANEAGPTSSPATSPAQSRR